MTRGERQERGRADIVAAAAALLAREGAHGLSMRALARATGQSLANLYNYFASKDDVLFEVQSRAFDTLLADACQALDAAGTPESRLHAFIYSHVRFVAAHPDVLRVLVQQAGALPPGRRRAVRERKERYFQLGRDAVRAVIAEGGHARDARRAAHASSPAEIERATFAVFGMLNWVYAWYVPGQHGSPEDLARTIHGLALGGLVGRDPHRELQVETERRVAARLQGQPAPEETLA